MIADIIPLVPCDSELPQNPPVGLEARFYNVISDMLETRIWTGDRWKMVEPKPVKNFTEGWAVAAFTTTNTSHYFQRTNDRFGEQHDRINGVLAVSLCGTIHVSMDRIFEGVKNAKSCKICERNKLISNPNGESH